MGTGARALGDVLLKEVRAVGAPLHATALLTHLHFDHILGLPFFGPFMTRARLTVHGPVQPKGSLKDALHAAVQPRSSRSAWTSSGRADHIDTWDETSPSAPPR